jgi:hypothetical protein
MATIDQARTERKVEDHPLLHARSEVPGDLQTAAAERGWPDEFVRRAVDLRVPTWDLQMWLESPEFDVARVGWLLDTLGRTFDGPLRVREATWRDGEAVVQLYTNAPEQIGEWRLDVQRGPNPYAAFRLQEHPNVQIVECRGVVLGAVAHATRNSVVGGQRLSVHFISAWRVREGFRGYGLANVLQMAAGPASAWFGIVTYWYERFGNASQGWLDKIKERDDDELTASVHVVPVAGAADLRLAADDGLVVRPVRPEDLPRCVELVNGTHAGLDLFRPYTVEFLESHLDDPAWGPKPTFWAPVFGWGDYAVVEDPTGAVLACGGLWDRGRDIREVWRNEGTAEQRTIEATALLDWGYAAGRADAMGVLLGAFIERTRLLGRTHLLAPLQHTPEIAALVRPANPELEVRRVRSMTFEDEQIQVGVSLTRPYTDLAYW